MAQNTCEITQNGEPRNKASHAKPNVLRGSASDFATKSYPGTRSIAEIAGKIALSEIPGVQTGAIDFDSDSVAIIRKTLLDELQSAWQTFGRLDLQTDLAAKRKALWRIRDRFSKLMNEIEALR